MCEEENAIEEVYTHRPNQGSLILARLAHTSVLFPFCMMENQLIYDGQNFFKCLLTIKKYTQGIKIKSPIEFAH